MAIPPPRSTNTESVAASTTDTALAAVIPVSIVTDEDASAEADAALHADSNTLPTSSPRFFHQNAFISPDSTNHNPSTTRRP